MRDRRRQPDAAAARRQRDQPRDAQRQLVAALGAGQRVHLVHHHGAQAAEHARRIRVGQQHRQALRRGQQDVAAAASRWRARRSGGVSPVRVSIADRQAASPRPAPSGCARCRSPAPSAARYRACAAPRAAPAASSTRLGRKPGQRLAAAGRRDQQHAVARPAPPPASRAGAAAASSPGAANQRAKRSGNVPAACGLVIWVWRVAKSHIRAACPKPLLRMNG